MSYLRAMGTPEALRELRWIEDELEFQRIAERERQAHQAHLLKFALGIPLLVLLFLAIAVGSLVKSYEPTPWVSTFKAGDTQNAGSFFSPIYYTVTSNKQSETRYNSGDPEVWVVSVDSKADTMAEQQAVIWDLARQAKRNEGCSDYQGKRSCGIDAVKVDFYQDSTATGEGFAYLTKKGTTFNDKVVNLGGAKPDIAKEAGDVYVYPKYFKT